METNLNFQNEHKWEDFQKKFSCFQSYFKSSMKSSCFSFSFGHYDTFENNAYVLKRFSIMDSGKFCKFVEYLKLITKFHDFDKYTAQTNFVIGIDYSINKENHLIYVVQDRKSTPLTEKIDNFKEIDVIWILKKILNLFCNLRDEDKLFSLMIEIGISPININSIYIYRKIWESKNSLTKNKIKFDLISFISLSEKPKKDLHLEQLSKFIRLFDVKKFGICLRGLLHRLDEKKNVTWDLLFAHPLFLQNIDSNIDKIYWKFTEEDKKYLKGENDICEKTQVKFGFDSGQKKPQINKSLSTNEKNHPKEPKLPKKQEKNNKKDVMDRIKSIFINAVKDWKKKWGGFKNSQEKEIKEYEAMGGWIFFYVDLFKISKLGENESFFMKRYKNLSNTSKIEIEKKITGWGLINEEDVINIKKMSLEK